MKVVIKDKIYTVDDDGPIGILLSDSDKENIQNMPKGAGIYVEHVKKLQDKALEKTLEVARANRYNNIN